MVLPFLPNQHGMRGCFFGFMRKMFSLALSLQILQVGIHHDSHQFFEANARFPAQQLACFRGVAN
jgi:hypothetical protein